MIAVLDKSHFKSSEIQLEWPGVKPTLQLLLFDMRDYCLTWQMPFLITDLTSTEAEDIRLNRKSKTHRQGRAADLRCKLWPEWFITQFSEHFESKYKHVAALAGIPLQLKLVVRHIGTEDHIHVQIRSNT